MTIYRPKGAKGSLPVVMYYHGGGWVLGSKNTHDRLLRDLVNGTNAAFVFVNYTPSPEAQFPIPIEQGFAATNMLRNMATSLVSIPHGLRWPVTASAAIWPPSSLSSPKSAKARRIRYQVLFYPVTDASLSQESYKEFADGPWLTTAAMKWFWDAYAPNKADRKKTMASPLAGDAGTTERSAASTRYRRRK